MTNLETLEKNIEIIKENLKTLPRNTSSDKLKFQDYIKDALNKFSTDREVLHEEIKNRCTLLLNLQKNVEVDDLKKQIKDYNISYLLDDFKSSYEKFKLDIPLYDIEHFYKADLEKVNTDIKYCIDVFNKASIKFDFNYSIYARKYMDTLINNDSKILEEFKNLYSKCPNLITHLEVNIKSIYYRNVKALDKYYNVAKPKININDYHNLLKNSEILFNTDPYNIFNMFVTDELQVKKFNDINDLYEKYNFNSLDSIYNLYHDLYEYKNYLKYKYVVDDIIERYKDKDKNKGLYDGKLKEINKLEKSLFKTNGIIFKLEKKKVLNDKQEKKLNLSVLKANNLILELKGLYDELLDLRMGDKILKYLDDSSSIFDVLVLGSSFYDYMVDLIKKDNPSVTIDAIKQEIFDIRKFLCGPYLNIVRNLNLNFDKDISMVIYDKYKLLNIPIDIEAISNIESIEKILDDLYNIIINESLKNVPFKLSDVDFYIKVNKNLGSDFLLEKL